MSFRPAALAVLGLWLFSAIAVPAFADDPSPTASTTTTAPQYYFSESGSAFGGPSGMLNLGTDNTQNTTFPTTPVATTDDDVDALKGCGGIGQGDYTSALFNMPEVFDKFKKDVNSELAKQILTYNYSLPQTAALFDTLNSYGNARYQQFQQACKLDSLKQDAKNQYMSACVKEQVPIRMDIVTKAYDAAQTANAANNTNTSTNAIQSAPQVTNKDDIVKAQAYAQAWEVCSMQYASDDAALKKRKESGKAFADVIRGTENVNESIRPLLCPAATNTSSADATNTSNSTTACWPLLLVPQVRLCNGSDLSGGCTPSTDYGVKEAPLQTSVFFDLMRFIMNNKIVPDWIDQVFQKIKAANIDPATLSLAADKTKLTLSRGLSYSSNIAISDPLTAEFQKDYLNCSSNNMKYALQTYVQIINGRDPAQAADDTGNHQIVPSQSVAVNLNDIGVSDLQTIIDAQLKLPAAYATDKAALPSLALVALGCTANQTIPIFDPYIVTDLQTQCNATDTAAFYDISSNDVALTATRDTYRYLSLKLKEVYARLLTEKGAGIKQPAATTAADGAATTPDLIDSPELRERLARVVKEVMIPAVDEQIARLNELAKVRGEFAKRVEKIYSTKSGCIYTNAGGGPG
ncbi:MAG: hypothetical protein GC129_01490 [Proteobacteria bacterium]|nr:hypothetical protein [Pseudomonadota bacterium]